MNKLRALFKDKEFTGKLSAIAIPIALQNLINFGTNALDTIMLGRIGEIQLSASSVSNQFSFVFMVLTMGVSSGCGVLSAQYWGAGDVKKVREIISFMYRIVAGMTLIFAAIAIFAPGAVLNLIIEDQEVISNGIIYLRILGFGYLLWGFNNATISILRTVGTVKISVFVYSITLVVNFCLNYVLIFGKFGIPALGIAGAAYATVIARVIEFAIIMTYMFKYEPNVKMRLSDLLHSGKGTAALFLQHSSPVVLNEMLWTSGDFIIGMIIGHIGREFVAANSICGLMYQFAGIACFGVSSAASTIIGNTIGEGRYDKAKDYANGILAFSIVLGIFSFIGINIIRIPLINFYNISEVAQSYAQQLTAVVSVLVIFQSIALTSMMGTLRGGGDTKFVMVTDLVFLWIIAIPLGALTAHVLHWPGAIVYAILKSEDLFKTIIVLIRIPRGKWLRDITRSFSPKI